MGTFLTVNEIARAKGMSKTNAWWHVRKLGTPGQTFGKYVKGTLKLSEAEARKLMQRIDAVPELKKQSRGKREK
jgi:hypothetical protein